jgi:hypothetical protein
MLNTHGIQAPQWNRVARRLFRKAVQQGRSERSGESYSVPYVEPLSDARTPLAGFINSLLRVRTPLCGDTPLVIAGFSPARLAKTNSLLYQRVGSDLPERGREKAEKLLTDQPAYREPA